MKTKVKSKRGVKPGTKRGKYKKNKEFLNEIPADETPANEIPQNNYDDFLKEFGSPEPVNLEVLDNDKAETFSENKSFDFSQNSNLENQNFSEIKKQTAVFANGYMLLALCDILIPGLIKYIYSFIDKRAKNINVSKVKLDEEQRESLMNCADEAAKYIFSQINPIILFFVVMGTYYYANIQVELSKEK